MRASAIECSRCAAILASDSAASSSSDPLRTSPAGAREVGLLLVSTEGERVAETVGPAKRGGPVSIS